MDGGEAKRCEHCEQMATRVAQLETELARVRDPLAMANKIGCDPKLTPSKCRDFPGHVAVETLSSALQLIRSGVHFSRHSRPD